MVDEFEFGATLEHEGKNGSASLSLDVNDRIKLEKPIIRGSCLFTRI